MRSYYAHLESAIGPSKNVPILSKPTYRASAIFPVVNRPGITSRILFMGYWILKRHIREIATVVNLRSKEGLLLGRSAFTIQEPKTFRIELKDQLVNAGMSPDTEFTGSLEVEFFSTVNLVFPFPATVINYYGKAFSSVVHTAQRIYNDFEDMQKNSQTDVPESGFNIYADDDHEPFFGLINGSDPIERLKIDMEFYNSNHQMLIHTLDLGHVNPYQTQIIYPAQLLPLQNFLNGKVGAAKIRFHLNWVFPRLIVGNIQHSLPAVTITHTYYDCTKAQSETDYWRPNEPQWYPASLMIPLSVEGLHFTKIYFYPIYSPSTFFIDVEIYNSEGHLLGKKENLLKIVSPSNDYLVIDFKELCKELEIPQNQTLGARIIARTKDNERIPSRIKIGLDIGLQGRQMPCNICTNLQPFNPPLETKPKSFRWAPILADQPQAMLWIMNSSPHVKYERETEVELTFFRESDTSTLTRRLKLPPHGFCQIHLPEDKELDTFFEKQVGWVTAITSNPYTTIYYFAENPSGVVGGDHGF
jgi:hypothetical protein